MSQGVFPLAADCPTRGEHEFRIPLARGAVTGHTLHCPSCAGAASAADELTEMVAARRLTLAGLAALPAGIRADLAARGTLSALYATTVAEVREVAERCRGELGGELPAGLRIVREQPDRGAAGAVLDAAADWLAGHPR
jgi:hypothetical protein